MTSDHFFKKVKPHDTRFNHVSFTKSITTVPERHTCRVTDGYSGSAKYVCRGSFEARLSSGSPLPIS